MKKSMHKIQGTAQLAFDSIEGVTNRVEKMHATIAEQPLPWQQDSQSAAPAPAHGNIAASVYNIIRGVNDILRVGVDESLELVAPRESHATISSTETKVTAALNGAFGDHLESTDNPLAIAMQLKTGTDSLTLDGESITDVLPDISGRIVVMVHGLGLSDLNWSRDDEPSIGSRLHNELGYTPLYLRYNTGRHIWRNGEQFSQMLQQLFDEWPVPVESICLIGHSMGGLVIRSACCYAQRNDENWLQSLENAICLGTPHHGSAVAKAGHLLDAAMQWSPYTKPLAVGRHRSAGIKDLRYGALLEEDSVPNADSSTVQRPPVVPLLPDVSYYFAAATLGAAEGDPLGLLLGDLLVSEDSAVGSDSDELVGLDIAPENCRVFHGRNHFDLLGDEEVHRQVVSWLTAD